MRENAKNGDAEYVKALRKGDLNAFNKLFEKVSTKDRAVTRRTLEIMLAELSGED